MGGTLGVEELRDIRHFFVMKAELEESARAFDRNDL